MHLLEGSFTAASEQLWCVHLLVSVARRTERYCCANEGAGTRHLLWCVHLLVSVARRTERYCCANEGAGTRHLRTSALPQPGSSPELLINCVTIVAGSLQVDTACFKCRLMLCCVCCAYHNRNPVADREPQPKRTVVLQADMHKLKCVTHIGLHGLGSAYAQGGRRPRASAPSIVGS